MWPLLQYCNQNRGDSLRSVTVLESPISKAGYLASTTDLQTLENDFMTTYVVKVETPFSHTQNWSLWNIHMCHVGGFYSKENRWDTWAIDLRRYVTEGTHGVFLKPLCIAGIENAGAAKTIQDYISKMNSSKKEAFMDDALGLLSGKKKSLKEDNTNIKRMTRGRGI